MGAAGDPAVALGAALVPHHAYNHHLAPEVFAKKASITRWFG